MESEEDVKGLYRITDTREFSGCDAYEWGERGFSLCRLDVGGGDNDSDYRGNQTIVGQLTTFMEGLHLTYNEVFREIPYRQLQLMSVDKLRPADQERGENGEEIKRKVVSGKEMLKKRKEDGEA